MDDSPWTLSISGMVTQKKIFTLQELFTLPQTEFTVDIHCVTRWSILGAKFGGIELKELLHGRDTHPAAKYLSFVSRSTRNHSSSLPLKTALKLGSFIAVSYEGKPLSTDHGGPIRIIVPGKYFYKSVKWLERIELLTEDRLGFWESESGYNNHADPWLEERYISNDVPPALLQALLTSRDLSDQTLLSLQAPNISLPRLNATSAILRNANFHKADLQDANFSGANLSNANLTHSNLRAVNFQNADLEGVDFHLADIRGTNFSDASLFGATFCSSDAATGAFADTNTKFTANSIEGLSPDQLAYLVQFNVTIE